MGLAKLRAVGAAAHLSTRPHICLERCDLGVAYGEGLLHIGVRHVYLPHPAVVLLEDPCAILRIWRIGGGVEGVQSIASLRSGWQLALAPYKERARAKC